MKNKIIKIFEDANTGYPGSFSRVGINPSSPSGLISRCPSIPLQGAQAIHEEDTLGSIEPLALGNLSIEGYYVVEKSKPTTIRYKVLKDGVPLPIDAEKKNSKNIGHTKELVLKKLSMRPEKNQFIRKFLEYSKKNEESLQKQKQEKVV